MNEKIGKIVTDKPLITLLAVLFITVLLVLIDVSPGTFGLEKHDEEDESSFLPDNEVANAAEEIDENYGVQRQYLIIIVQGKNGDVLTREALIDILEVEKRVAENPKVKEVLFPQPGNISSLSSALARKILDNDKAGYDEMLGALQALDTPALKTIIRNASQDEESGPQLARFLTKDFQKNQEKNITKAKGSRILVMLNADKYDEIVEGGYNPILDVDEEILKIFDSSDFKGVRRMGIIEEEYISQQIEEETGGVMGRLFIFVILLVVLILLFTYRSIFDTLISLLALFFAIFWMRGIGVLLGINFSTMGEVVPIMLVGLGIDYAIHLVMRYREERVHYGKTIKDALVLTTASVGAALFLATLTTSISFGSNTVSEIKPMKEFAILALVGIVSAFIVMVTFVPASKMLYHTHLEPRIQSVFGKIFKRRGATTPQQPLQDEKLTGPMNNAVQGKKSNHSGTDNLLSKFLAKGAVAAEHHAYPVVAVVVVVSLICTGLALRLETEFDFTEFLPADAQISDDIVYLTDNFEFGTEESNVLVKGKIDDPVVLKAMDDTQKNIENDKYVNEQDPIESILTLMHEVAAGGGGDVDFNQTFSTMYNDSHTDDDGVPDRNITGLFAFLMEHDDYKAQTIRVLHFNNDTKEYDGAVIRVGVNSKNGAKSKEIYDDMNNGIKPLEELKGKENQNGDILVDKAIATSGPVLIHMIIRSIEVSGMLSLLITVVVAGIVLTIVFYITDKSLILGIITEIPVILVIAWVFASMYLIDMPLNVMTIMIASLTVGLGITYGIHITHRFVEDLSELDDIDEACRSTVANTGAALFGAAVTTIGGFGILVFAPIPPLRKFGAISALAIFFSLIASVFVLPTILSLWAKWVKKKDPYYFQHHADVQKMIEEKAATCEMPGENARMKEKEYDEKHPKPGLEGKETGAETTEEKGEERAEEKAGEKAEEGAGEKVDEKVEVFPAGGDTEDVKKGEEKAKENIGPKKNEDTQKS